MKNNRSVNNPNRFEYEDIFKGNEKLRSKKVIIAVCIVFLIIILIASNMIWQAIAHIGEMIRGEFSARMMFQFTANAIPLYIFVLVAGGCVSAVFAYKMYSSFRNINYGQKGWARFQTQQEIASRFTAVPEKDKSFPGWGGIPLSRIGGKLYIDQTPTNSLIVAITRAGKTQTQVIGTIDIVSRAENKASMLICDVKRELSKASVGKLIDRGYKVIIYDFAEFYHSHFFNPLEVITQSYIDGDVDFAEELCFSLAHSIYEDKNAHEQYWVEAPRSLFIAVVLAFVADCVKNNEREKITLYSVFVFIATLGEISDEKKLKSELDNFFLRRPVDDPARLQFTSIKFSQGRNRSSVMSLAVNKLAVFIRPNVARMMSKSTIDLTELGFGDKPVAVFFAEPFYTRTYDIVITTYIHQCFYMNMHRAAMETNSKMPRHVKVIGDEIFNFPPLPRLDNMMTVCLGSNWSFDLYAQSFSQIEDVYGKNTAKTVTDNCATRFYLASPAEETRKIFSELIGKKTIISQTRSGSRLSLDKSFTEQVEERPLITAQELTTLTENESVVFPTMRRTDLKGNPVMPMPILNSGKSRMTYTFEYLPDFDVNSDIPYERLNPGVGGVDDVNLHALLYLPNSLSNDIDAESMVSQRVNEAKLAQINSILEDLGIEMEYDCMPMSAFKSNIHDLHKNGEIPDEHYSNIKKLIGR